MVLAGNECGSPCKVAVDTRGSIISGAYLLHYLFITSSAKCANFKSRFYPAAARVVLFIRSISALEVLIDAVFTVNTAGNHAS